MYNYHTFDIYCYEYKQSKTSYDNMPNGTYYYIGYYRNYLTYVTDDGVPQALQFEDLERWDFINVEEQEDVYNYFLPISHEITFYTKEEAQFFMDEYLFPQMIAANIVSKKINFKI